MTGRPLWEDRVDTGNTDELQAIAVVGNRVVVTGIAGHGSGDEAIPDSEVNTDFYVRAYDAPTGDVGWTDRYDSGRHDWGMTITTQADRVIAAGGAAGEFFVRAYLAD